MHPLDQETLSEITSEFHPQPLIIGVASEIQCQFAKKSYSKEEVFCLSGMQENAIDLIYTLIKSPGV